MVEVYAQVVPHTKRRGNTQVVPCLVLSHPGVASHTVLTTVGLKRSRQSAYCADRTGGCEPLRPHKVCVFWGPCSETHVPTY